MYNLKQTMRSVMEEGEAGHAYAYGGGSILAVVLLIILLIWLL